MKKMECILPRIFIDETIELAIKNEKQESGMSQTEQEIEMIRDLIKEGYLSYEGMREDFLKYGAKE